VDFRQVFAGDAEASRACHPADADEHARRLVRGARSVDAEALGPERLDACDLIYVKPTVYGDAEPRDVLQYKEAHEEFPHQSTGDQFFDEPQFESYRMLGWHIMNLICENRLDLTHGADELARPSYALNKAQFVTAALQNYKGHEQQWLADLLTPSKRWLA
jgi:hypothetical protein